MEDVSHESNISFRPIIFEEIARNTSNINHALVLFQQRQVGYCLFEIFLTNSFHGIKKFFSCIFVWVKLVGTFWIKNFGVFWMTFSENLLQILERFLSLLKAFFGFFQEKLIRWFGVLVGSIFFNASLKQTHGYHFIK